METGRFNAWIVDFICPHIVDLPQADSPVIPIKIRFWGLFISLFENFEIKCGIILADMASKVYSINQLKEYIIKDTDFLDVSKKHQ